MITIDWAAKKQLMNYEGMGMINRLGCTEVNDNRWWTMKGWVW